MTGTSDLRSEHIGVGRMLGIMDGMAASARNGARPDPEDLARVVDFLRVFVDKCHHTKEEDLLFPALRRAGVVSTEATIVQLLADHVQGRELVAQIAEAARRLGGGDESARDELAGAMEDYAALLHAHIRREENDCFDVADRELPPDVQGGLEEGYEQVEREVVGDGVHEAFHTLLDRLERAYRS